MQEAGGQLQAISRADLARLATQRHALGVARQRAASTPRARGDRSRDDGPSKPRACFSRRLLVAARRPAPVSSVMSRGAASTQARRYRRLAAEAVRIAEAGLERHGRGRWREPARGRRQCPRRRARRARPVSNHFQDARGEELRRLCRQRDHVAEVGEIGFGALAAFGPAMRTDREHRQLVRAARRACVCISLATRLERAEAEDVAVDQADMHRDVTLVELCPCAPRQHLRIRR